MFKQGKKGGYAIALALGAAFSGQIHAQVQAEPAAASAAKPFLSFGLTGGGDKLATAQYSNGTSSSVVAGGTLQLGAGVEFPVGSAFALSVSLNYHVSSADANNGSITFDRAPIEFLAQYKLNDQWRVGGGARLVDSAKLSGSGAGELRDVEFDSTTGSVIQAEYMFSPKGSVVVRGVSEKYTVKGLRGSVDGSHIGVFYNLYFN